MSYFETYDDESDETIYYDLNEGRKHFGVYEWLEEKKG